MANTLTQILIDQKDGILQSWHSKKHKFDGQKNDVPNPRIIFDFFLQISQIENGKVEKLIDDFILHHGLKEADWMSKFLNDLILMKNLISQVAADKLGTSNEAWKLLSDFSERFERSLLIAVQRYHTFQTEILKGQKKIFEKANEFMRTAVDFANLGLIILDEDSRVIYWGSSVEKIFACSEAEALNKSIFEVIPTLKDSQFLEKLESSLEQNQEIEIPAVIHKKSNGNFKIIDYKISPLTEKDGKTIGAYVLLHDITMQRKDQASLKEYQQFLSNIFEDAAEAIFVLDENDHVKMWNKQAAKMYGYSADEMIGKHISLLVPNDKKSMREIDKINQLVREKGYVKDWEAERITHDGRKLLLRITRTAIKDEKGNYRGSSVIAHDITEQRRLEQQLIHSEKLSAVGQLAAGIAHEVGSPLTAISSLSQLLYERIEDEWSKDKLKIIREQIDRIARIVRELVNFSKPISTDIKEISINQIIKEALEIVKYDKRLKPIKIKLDLFPELPLIKASFDQLLQVFINIILNAGDALEGKAGGEIVISTQLVGEKIITRIMDNGCGIPEKNLDHIFEPFFTTKKAGKGTGLGLWVCYNIIKGFSGEIVVESEVNHGTVFHIILPVLKNLDTVENE